MRGATQAHELHVASNRHADMGHELAMEMKLREATHPAQQIQGQVTIQMRVDVGEYDREAARVSGG